ncbi:MAG: 4-(cytidine 5'-diphospho)-2-C-methyl-D-erythritol kinase [Dehalococcoidales bacterium]|nr:4-(cytidine 5'-diphospho)-2-C-methyl-D-erythritol kinase [Dehalococcoidales bacterium]
MLTIQAPAKINLTLEALNKRPDGYHNIRSIIQSVDLCDMLTFESSQRLIIESNLPEWSAEKSLILRTIQLVHKKCRMSPGIAIKLLKRIPMVAGLGGDSSNAAATLKGLNEIWQLNMSKEKLLGLAAELGSDVPFFLDGGTALMEGRGENITPLLKIPETWFVVMVPDIPRPANKTARLYAGLQANHYTDGQITEHFMWEIREGKPLRPELLFNTFENVAFEQYAGLGVYRDHILKIGAANVHLAGSGPALFSLVKNKAEGEELVAKLKSPHLDLHLVKTMVNMGNGE